MWGYIIGTLFAVTLVTVIPGEQHPLICISTGFGFSLGGYLIQKRYF